VIKPLLLLMDYQEGICREDGPIGAGGTGAQVAARGVLESAAAALAEFRNRDWPAVHARVAFDEHYIRLTSASPRFAGMERHGLMQESDRWTSFCTEVLPRSTEPVITKGCVNPFIGTHLAQTLIRLAPSELVLGGVATNHVVEAAARHGADSGYRIVVLEDLCASFSVEAHESSVKHNLPFYARLTTADEYFADKNNDTEGA
jgi:nicotinamidase-related amidase